MKTTILWDHDGVLVDTEPLFFEATRLKFAELGIVLHQDDYIRDMARGISAWERVLAAGVSRAEVNVQKDHRNEIYQDFLRNRAIEIDGVETVLAQLRPDYAMAIVTTARRADFDLIHRDRRIRQYMSFVLTNGDYQRKKPFPDPYLAALERFGASKAETVVVEDSERGLRSAVAAGIDCVVVENAFVKGQDFSAATHRIDSLQRLPALLREM